MVIIPVSDARKQWIIYRYKQYKSIRYVGIIVFKLLCAAANQQSKKNFQFSLTFMFTGI